MSNRNIFEARKEFKPYEYPEVDKFKEAIQHSYWLVSEFNFDSDVQDFHVNLTEAEKSAIKNALLAISQIEVSVKRFWGKIGDKMPKAEIEQVGATFSESECFDDSTEVLTSNGWKLIKDVSANEKVAQFDMQSSSIDFATPLDHISRHYNGFLHVYQCAGNHNKQSFRVTPGHEIIVMHPQKNIWEKRPSENGKWSRNYRYPVAGLGNGNYGEFSPLDRLLVAFQADGSRMKDRRVAFDFHKERKIQRLELILRELNIDFQNKPTVAQKRRITFTIPKSFGIDMENLKSFGWINLENVNSIWGKEFLNELSLWDSSAKVDSNRSFTYYNTNVSALDKVQAIAVLSGWHAVKGVNRTAEEMMKVALPTGQPRLSSKTCYAMTVNNRNKRVYPYRHEEWYEGNVYCLKMPKGTLVARHNGYVFISGNCRHSEAYSKLLEVLGLNDEFTMLLQNPVIQGRVDYLTKYLKNASDNSNEAYALTLALFSLFIENVSLFSQFLVIKSFSKNRNMLKAVDNVIQATIREECYVDGTEVLTPTGWKLIDSMKVGDEVYQYNYGKLEETKVLHTVSHEYDGSVYRFHNSKMDCRVTPNHDMIIFSPKGEMKKIKAKDFVPHSKQLFPVSAEKSGGVIDHLTALDRIKIAVEADGNSTYWINKAGEVIQRGKNGGMNYDISLTRDRKKRRFEQLLSQSTIPYNSSPSTGKPNEMIYKVHLDMGIDYKSFGWVDLHDKSAQWCREFIDELTFWDGYNYDGRIGYASSKKRSIDMVQAIGVLAGYKTNVPNAIGKRKDDGTQYRPCYKVSFSRNNTVSSHGIHREKIDYKGNVSCVTVPSGVIVTRYNQKTTIAGNCLHALFGSYLVNIIKSENPTWFNDEFNEKLIRASKKAYVAECAIVDWMFEKGEIDGLPKDSVKEFIKHRLNESMKLIGFNKIFDIDSEKIAKVYWFIEELYADVNSDFFYKRPTNYSKKRRSVTASDLF